MKKDDIVYFNHHIQYWDRPYVMKRHYVYDVKSVTLRGIVIEINGNQFKALLTDNNGFEMGFV